MLVILSPAKTMDMANNSPTDVCTVPAFKANAEFLASEMSKFSVEELGKSLKINSKLTELNFERFSSFNSVDTPEKQAIFAYTGSVFKNMNPYDFTAEELSFTQSSVRVISPLYGTLRPMDSIKAYRMSYGVKIGAISLNLYSYWKEVLTESLISDVKNNGGVLVNLASLDVLPAFDMARVESEVKVVTLEFKDEKDGKFKTINTYAKIARGLMTRYIVKNRVENIEKLKKFDTSGYKFNDLLSSDINYVFTR